MESRSTDSRLMDSRLADTRLTERHLLRLMLHSLFVSVDAPHYRQRDRELREVTKEK